MIHDCRLLTPLHRDISERVPLTFGKQLVLVRLVEYRAASQTGAPDLRLCIR